MKFCCLGRRRDNNPLVTGVVTAINRVEAAQRARDAGKQILPSINSSASFVICPHLARKLLECEETLSSSKSTDEEEDEDPSPSNATTSTTSDDDDVIPTRLHKPEKRPNILLGHSLTNANGSDWKRQRRLLQRAFAKSKTTRLQAAQEASHKATELVLLARNNNDVVDIRDLALQIAVSTIATAVFGKNSQSQRVQDLLRPLFLPTLRAVHREEGQPQLASKLHSLVSEVVEEIALQQQQEQQKKQLLHENKNEMTTTSCCKYQNCLALQFYDCEDPTREENQGQCLTREEVISNCHSGLLAGTQTICTALAGAMLHLAERPDLQQQQQQSSSKTSTSRSIINETLRILPPVASLPRCPAVPFNSTTTTTIKNKNHHSQDHYLEVPSTNPTEPPLRIHQGNTVVIDTLSMAHFKNNTNGDMESTTATLTTTTSTSSWKFDPIHNKLGNIGAAAPWGMGVRRCPAGILSLDCIQAILDGFPEQSIGWKLVHPEMDGTGVTGQEGWVQSVYYGPTLTYPNPILVEFH